MAPAALGPRLCTLLACLMLAAYATAACVPGTASTGVMQMQSIDKTCQPGNRNGIFTACGSAFIVDVDSKGNVHMTPVVPGSVSWSGPGYTHSGLSSGTFACKDINGTGLLNGAEASIKMYDEPAGPFSQLSVEGSSIVFSKAKVYPELEQDKTVCTYTFKVVSGCILGVAAPVKPLVCSPGTVVKTGLSNVKYCSPCPAGSSSKGGSATKCTKCPAGTFSPHYASTCSKCVASLGQYAPKAGARLCSRCRKPSHYSNGVMCSRCPSGSFVNDNNLAQCHMCNGKTRCCTVGASSTCPKCAKGAKPGASYVSNFVMSSVSSETCGNLEAIRCNSNVTVSITPDCRVTALGTSTVRMPSICDFQSESRIFSGAKLNPFTDFPPLRISSMDLHAKLTSVSKPFLNFQFPAPIRCKFSLRALSPPAADLLGASPTPCPINTPGCAVTGSGTSPAFCPPGKYLVQNVGGTGYCALCPPGSFTNSTSAAITCDLCPAGTVAKSYGTSQCSPCPAGTKTKTGEAHCRNCDLGQFNNVSGSDTCSRCPAGSSSQQGWPYCLSINAGTPCCSIGICPKGMAACPDTRPGLSSFTFDLQGAVLKMVKGVGTTCKEPAAFIKCLRVGDLVSLQPNGYDGYGFSMTAININRCMIDGQPNSLTNAFYKDSTSAFGVANSPSKITQAFYLKASGRSTVVISRIVDKYVDKASPPPTPCSATFKLVAGYAFNLAPPPSAKCPAGGRTFTASRRSFCSFCNPGYYRKGAGCQYCPEGTYQDLFGAVNCKKCPPGSAGYGSISCSPCAPGTYAKGGTAACASCPANTYSAQGSSKCLACPTGTIAPAGSAGCNLKYKS